MINSGITNATRPKTLEEIVGMEDIKKLIKYQVEGCIKLQEPLPSFIIAGPAGTGKSTIAQIIATFSKRKDGSPAEIHEYIGSDIRSPDHITDMAAKSEDGDVIYIEESHTIGGGGNKAKIVQGVLLEWLENYKLTLANAGNNLSAPKVSFVLPTTNPGKLSKPLRTRCQFLHTSYYSVEDIMEILVRAASKLDIDLTQNKEALRVLAQSSRGTPRTAIMQRLDMLRKVMAVDELPYTEQTVKTALMINNVNEWGLEANDLKYCNCLYHLMEESNGRPVAKNTLEQVTGFETDFLEKIVEAYLLQINIIKIDGRGRSLTDSGYEVLGRRPLGLPPSEVILKKRGLDHEKLLALLADKTNWSRGVRWLCPQLGLSYPADVHIIKEALNSYGFDSFRGAGIKKVSDEYLAERYGIERQR